MKLLVDTIAERFEYTISKLYIDEKYFCDVLEDSVRDLSKCHKIAGRTAIPAGTYRVRMDVVSPKFSQYSFYQQYANGGRLPRLVNVDQFEGVLIHCGNTHNDSNGCLLVGQNKVVGKVINSRETFKKLYPILLAAHKRGEEICITINRKSY